MSRDNYEWAEANRSTVRAGTQALLQTSASLARSERVALETAEAGTSIVSELRTQTESLERAKNNLNHMNDQLTQSRKIIHTLYRRVFTNKFIVLLIIILEIAVLGSVVYLKFFKKS